MQHTKPDKKMCSRLQQLTTRNACSTNALITFHILWKFLVSCCLTVHLQYNNAEKERPLHLLEAPDMLRSSIRVMVVGGIKGSHQEITSDKGENLKKRANRENSDSITAFYFNKLDSVSNVFIKKKYNKMHHKFHKTQD